MEAGPRVALVVPTLNEGEAIGTALAGVPRDLVSDVVVADGGSTDETASKAKEAGARVIAAGRGYGRACLAGALAAGDACDILVFMDGDGSDRPEMIPDLVAPIAGGTHDFVVGSRVRGVREPGSMGAHQVLAGRLIGGTLGALYGVRYTDMGAFRAIRRDRLLSLSMREMTYGWNLEMQMRAAHAGLRVLELPVPYGRRTRGVSKVAGSLPGTFRAGTHILLTLVRVAADMRQRSRANG